MNTNSAIKAIALVLVLASLFIWRSRDGVEIGERGRATVPAAAAPAEREVLLDGGLHEVDVAGREEAATAAEPPEATVGAGPWAGPLAGLTGRILETDGTPVVKISVALLEFDMDMLFVDPTPGASQAASLEIGSTVTDERGRFVLGGARAPAFHGLGVDLGGARSTLRVIDSALAHERLTDLGDIVLTPYGTLTGRVVDESGRAIEGARIRLAPLPVEILLGAPYELRAESLVAVSMMLSTSGEGVIELPPWFAHALERLPIPTTHSDTDGFFRLAGVALAELVGGVDRRGYAGIPLGPIDLRSQTEQDLGELVLTRGRTVEGYVETDDGDPVAGVVVYAGAEVPAGLVAILQPCGETDAEGHFALSGVPPEGQVVAVARRSPNDPWTSDVTLKHDDLWLAFGPTVALTVVVQDEAGERLRSALITLEPKPMDSGMMGGISAAFQLFPRAVGLEDGFREVGPGEYVNEKVSAGSYELTARVRGLAPGKLQVELTRDRCEIIVTCPAGESVDVTILDGATRAPVENASVRIMEASFVTGIACLATGRSDGTGQVRLGPLARRHDKEDAGVLVVRHPRYADHSVVLASTGLEIIVALQRGGTLAGHVHLAGELPTLPYMLVLEPRAASGLHAILDMPRFSLSDPTGTFRVESLAPGTYQLELLERFLDRDPLGFLADSFEPATLHRETIVIEDGLTTELEIDLSATGRGPVARLQGRVRSNGRALDGASVSVRSNGTQEVTTDSQGWYDTGDFSLDGDVRIVVEGNFGDPAGGGRMSLYLDPVRDLRPGETRQVDVDVFPMMQRVEVVHAGTGEPIVDALVVTNPVAGEALSMRFGASADLRTDVTGAVMVSVMRPGEYRVTVRASEFAHLSCTIQITGAETVRLELPSAVPCAGRVVVPQSLGTGQPPFCYIQVSNDETEGSAMMLSPPDFEFDLEGLAEGDYEVMLYINGRIGEERGLSLRRAGARDLLFDFVPK